MVNRIFAIAAFLLLSVTAFSAHAATAISFSEVDNTYGWCTGYSTSEAPGCAKQWCEQSNGSDCQLALICDPGWNAVAFAETADAVGFGAACDMGSAYVARIVALASCMVQSRTICWTNSTFNGDGDERGADDNREFDLTWFIQGLLHGLGYDPGTTDGEFGNKTRAAIKAFQSDMGIEQTGAVTEELFYLMLTRYGGAGLLAVDMQTLVDNFTTDEESRAFRAAYSPMQPRSISEEIAVRSTSIQRILFADYLRGNGKDCPGVASRAVTEDASAGSWDILCSNGTEFTVFLSADGDSNTITEHFETAEAEPEPEPEVVEEPDQPPPPSTNGKDKSNGPTRGKDKG